VGKLAFILEEHQVPQEIINKIDELQNQGKTVIVVSTRKEIEGIIALEDKVRSDSARLISQLRSLGVQPVMLTGDHAHAAEAVAKRIGIDQVKADLLPDGKAGAVAELIEKYGCVAMFGDGWSKMQFLKKFQKLHFYKLFN